MGVGFASTDDNQFYAVFYYFPAGNYKNEFPNNVFPPIQQNYENLPKQQQPHPSSNITPIPSAQRAVLNQNDSSNKPKANGYDQQQPKYKNENISTSNFDSVQAKFIQEALEQHNECRRRHAVDPLVHNPELSKIAQEYANYLAKIRQLKHSTNKYNDQKLGENLAFSYDSTLDFYSGNLILNTSLIKCKSVIINTIQVKKLRCNGMMKLKIMILVVIFNQEQACYFYL